jgi:hypothetical protein
MVVVAGRERGLHLVVNGPAAADGRLLTAAAAGLVQVAGEGRLTLAFEVVVAIALSVMLA